MSYYNPSRAKWGEGNISRHWQQKKPSASAKPIWLCSTFPALCFKVDIDFGPRLAAAGCRSSEIPARPCEEANAARSKTKTTIGYGGKTENTGHLRLGLCSQTAPGASLVCFRATLDMLEICSNSRVDGGQRWRGWTCWRDSVSLLLMPHTRWI